MGIVQSFCCCGSLRQGAILSGILFMIRGMTAILVGIISIRRSVNPEGKKESLMYVNEKIVMPRSLSTQSGNSFCETLENKPYQPTKGWGIIFFGVLMIIVSVLLLVGVAKSNPDFLKPWIGIQTVEFCLAALIIIYLLAVGKFQVVYCGPFTVASVYCYIVVLAYYKALLNPQTTQVPAFMQMTEVSILTNGNPKQSACYVSLAGPGPPMTLKYGYPRMNPPIGYPAEIYATTPESPTDPTTGYPGSNTTTGCYLGTYDKMPGSPVSPCESFPKTVPAPGLDHGTYPRMPVTGYQTPAAGLETTAENDYSK